MGQEMWVTDEQHGLYHISNQQELFLLPKYEHAILVPLILQLKRDGWDIICTFNDRNSIYWDKKTSKLAAADFSIIQSMNVGLKIMGNERHEFSMVQFMIGSKYHPEHESLETFRIF